MKSPHSSIYRLKKPKTCYLFHLWNCNWTKNSNATSQTLGPVVPAFRLHYTAKDLMLLHKKAIYLCKIQIYYNRFSMKECLNGFKSKEFYKGQFNFKGISKVSSVLSKNRRNIRIYYCDVPQGQLIFVHFLEEIEDTKKAFRN